MFCARESSDSIQHMTSIVKERHPTNDPAPKKEIVPYYVHNAKIGHSSQWNDKEAKGILLNCRVAKKPGP